MRGRNEEAQNMAYDWVRWLNTRRFLAPSLPPGFLATLMPSQASEGEPDGPMSPEMPAFNAAVMALVDQRPDLAFPFLKVYCGVPCVAIKTLCGDIGVSRDSYYRLAHDGAAEVVRRKNIVINLGLLK